MGRSRLKLEYCCHFYTGGTQSTLSSLDRVQNLLCRLLGDGLFSSLHQKSSFPNRPNIPHLPLHYRHFHGKWSDDDNVPLFSARQLRILTAKNRVFTSTGLNPCHSLLISLVRRSFQTVSFFPETPTL